MARELTRLTHKIAIQVHLMAESKFGNFWIHPHILGQETNGFRRLVGHTSCFTSSKTFTIYVHYKMYSKFSIILKERERESVCVCVCVCVWYHRVQNGYGAHPASYPMVPGTLSLGEKRPGREVDNSPPCNAEIKNAWRYTSAHFMAWCLIKQKDNFTFTLYTYMVKLRCA
jgi:hypothetical protein